MKKQMMTALAVSAMMTLAMPFASFAASRSCQTGFRPGNNCGYTTDTNAISMVRTQGGCVISNGNAIGLYTVSGKGYPSWGTGNNCGTSFQERHAEVLSVHDRQFSIVLHDIIK